MNTNAEKTKRYTVDDWVRICIAAFIGIGGGQAINVASQPNERIAVLETRVTVIDNTVERSLPKINDKLDTLLMRVARLQK